MKNHLLVLATIIVLVGCTTAPQEAYKNPKLSAAERAADLCSRLTIEQKASLMMDRSPAIDSLDIPQFEWWNEALHGVARNGTATVFPITMAMASSFDDLLLHKVYTAVSDEGRAKNTEAKRNGDMRRYRGLSFWTPNINIFRDPRWGRGQETYGEDPYLTTRMGLAVVRGLQGYSYDGERPNTKYSKAFACAKHFAVHSGPEWNRHQFNLEDLPERDLWETYLPAFKALVQEGDVKEVMCAYQRFDGEPCCGNTRLLQQILRDDWGFQGLVTSDCGAISDFWKPGYHGYSPTREDAAARGVYSGTDLECGGDYSSLPQAVAEGKLTEEQMDVSLNRLLQARFELGDFDTDDDVEWTKIPMSVVASKEHHELALQMARESIVLLQNKGNILPLDKSAKIAVVGPNANDSVMLWGNYNGVPTHTVTILEGIRHYAPQATFSKGCGLTRPTVANSMFDHLYTPSGQRGLQATYWNNEEQEGEAAAQPVIGEPMHLNTGGNTAFAPGVNIEHFSALYEGVYRSEEDGEIMLNILNNNYSLLIFDGDTLLDKTNEHGVRPSTFTKKVKKGKEYPLSLTYVQATGFASLTFDIITNRTLTTAGVLQEVGDAETVVFVGGISPRLEGEEMKVNEEGFKGGDRTSIELPHVQRELIASLKKAGKKVVYVNCSGSAIALAPEAENADAIVQAWYGGEKGGEALADVLFGAYNPSGKLPVTFYRSTDQLPDYEDYNMKGRTYRYFEGEPLFPFGYGLSYTSFELGNPTWDAKKGTLSVSVTNTGHLDGTQTVMVFLKDPDDADGPIKSLRDFARVQLKPGEKKDMVFSLDDKAFALWNSNTNTMHAQDKTYTMMVGTSSADPDMKVIDVKHGK